MEREARIQYLVQMGRTDLIEREFPAAPSPATIDTGDPPPRLFDATDDVGGAGSFTAGL